MDDDTLECIVYLVVDEDGAYEVATDESDAGERFNDVTGGHHRQMYQLTLIVPKPKLIEVQGELKPNESGEHTLTIT